MTYYKVVISGENIFFENSCRIDTDSPEPVIGFITCKLIQAGDEHLAIATAKRDLLVHWNHSFNFDRKMGMPKLVIEHIAEVRGWFKPKSSNDYYWFTNEAHKQEQLEKLTQAPREWFWRKNSKSTKPAANNKEQQVDNQEHKPEE